MKTPSKRRGRRKKKPKKKRRFRLTTIPGWTGVDILLQDGVWDKRSVPAKNIFESLLITLWFDLGTRERREAIKTGCSGPSFSRALHHWVQRPASAVGLAGGRGARVLEVLWSAYLKSLPRRDVREWQRRLLAQAMTWRDAVRASLVAGRVHSPWFHMVFATTNRACGKPPLQLY